MGDLSTRLRVLRAVLLAAMALASLGVAAGPSCHVGPFQGATSAEGAIASMQVAAGASCSIVNYGVPGERSHPAGSGKVTQPPAHGKAEFSAPRITYTAQAGYVGADEFAYEAFARGVTDRPVRLRIRVKVTVTAP